MKKVLLLMVIFLTACTKVVNPPTPSIDLGTKSMTTNIKSVVQVNKTITAVFETTPGAKYAVQVVAFGSETPSFKDGFMANEVTTQKIYNLSNLAKSDYDLIFIDINGKEAKFPIIIK